MERPFAGQRHRAKFAAHDRRKLSAINHVPWLVIDGSCFYFLAVSGNNRWRAVPCWTCRTWKRAWPAARKRIGNRYYVSPNAISKRCTRWVKWTLEAANFDSVLPWASTERLRRATTSQPVPVPCWRLDDWSPSRSRAVSMPSRPASIQSTVSWLIR